MEQGQRRHGYISVKGTERTRVFIIGIRDIFPSPSFTIFAALKAPPRQIKEFPVSKRLVVITPAGPRSSGQRHSEVSYIIARGVQHEKCFFLTVFPAAR